MKADEIIQLLASRHSEDVFVPECKDGPTWSGEHLRLDAWAMRKSWSRPICWGYEVKVSRHDFLQDTKWQAYLPFCNEFYFVAPKGIINESELAPEAGLLLVAGTRLLCKKKSPYRESQIPEPLWRYLLMSRCQIKPRNGTALSEDDAKAGRVEMYRKWVEDKRDRRMIGHLIGSSIQDKMDDIILRNGRLSKYREATKLLARRLREIGIDPENPDWVAEHKIADFIRRLTGNFQYVERACTDMEKEIVRLRIAVKRCEESAKPETELEGVA